MDLNPWVLKMLWFRKIHWCVLMCIHVFRNLLYINNHIIWCPTSSSTKKNTAILRAVCQGFDMPMAPSFICPKVTGLWHHTRHRRTRPQDVDTPHLPVLKGMLLYLFPGHISFRTSKRSCWDFFPRSVCYDVLSMGEIKILTNRGFSDTITKKNHSGNPPSFQRRQVTWSVFDQHLPEVPSPRQWSSNDNEGPSCWPQRNDDPLKRATKNFVEPKYGTQQKHVNPVKNEEKMVMKIVIFSGIMGDSWTSEQWGWSTFCPNIVFPSIFGLASTHFSSLIWTKYYSIFFLSPKPTSLRTACGIFLPFQKSLRCFSHQKMVGFLGMNKKTPSKPCAPWRSLPRSWVSCSGSGPEFCFSGKTHGDLGVRSTWTEELWD